MTAYVPQNTNVFSAAFAGSLAGLAVSNRIPTSVVAADSAGVAAVAGAFAQSFDTEWGAVAANNFELETIQSMTQDVWENRAPMPVAPNFTPASFTKRCKSLIAIITAADAYLVSIGVTPNTSPASIGVTAPITSTGGATPTIGIVPATQAVPGSMSAADKTILDGLPAEIITGVAAHAMTAFDVDWSLSNTFSKTVGAPQAFTFSNTFNGQPIFVDVTGAFVITWPSPILWEGGVVPTQNARSLYTFVRIGADIWGSQGIASGVAV